MCLVVLVCRVYNETMTVHVRVCVSACENGYVSVYIYIYIYMYIYIYIERERMRERGEIEKVIDG